MLVVAIASLVIAFASLNEAKNASESAKESENIAKETLNLTLQSIKWVEEPRPLMSYSTSLDYFGNNRTASLQIVPFYNGTNTIFGGIESIKVTIYNSGRAPLMAPKLYLNLTANDINSTVFPFKIYKVQTPLDKIYYNYTTKKLFERFESPYNPEDTVELPLMAQDYPPYLNNNRIVYPTLFHKISTSSHTLRREYPNLIFDWNSMTQTDFLGPLEIGTIESGKKVEIEIWLFAAIEGDWADQGFIYHKKRIEENIHEWDICTNMTAGSEEQTKCLNQDIFSEYTTGNLRLIVESEKKESPIPPIDIPLRALFH